MNTSSSPQKQRSIPIGKALIIIFCLVYIITSIGTNWATHNLIAILGNFFAACFAIFQIDPIRIWIWNKISKIDQHLNDTITSIGV